MTTLQTMYPPQTNSPGTTTVGALTAGGTTVGVLSADVLPSAPTLLVLGGDTDHPETVLATAIADNVLTITRAVEGTAQSWPEGTLIARLFCAADLASVQANIQALLDGKQEAITATAKLAAALISGLAAVATSGSKSDVGLSNVANERQYSSDNPPPYPVSSVNGETGDVSVSKTTIGLGNVANERQYSAANPPPSDSSKQDKITASGLLKGNGSGGVSAAVSGTDYLAPSSKGAAGGVASLDANSKVTAEQAAARIVSISANTTLSSSHYGCLLLVTGTRTITIPTGLTVGTEIEIMNYGTGSVTVKANSGVTLNGVSAGSKAISSQYTGAVLKCVASNAWVVQGAIA